MKENGQIVFSGVGGQGLIVCADVLGEAAMNYEGKNVVMTTAHGVEMRGTFSSSDLIIDTGRIDYPECLEPDIVISLAQVAYGRYSGKLAETSILVFDSDQVKGDGNAYDRAFPITSLAKSGGNPASANFVAVGLVVGLTGIVSTQSVMKVIDKKYAGTKFYESNVKAFNLGLEASNIQ